MLGPALLKASTSPRLRRMVEQSRLTRGVVDRFIAGSSADDSLAVVAELHRLGRTVTIDFLGEDITTLAAARAVRDEYLRLLDQLAAGNLAHGAEVSVKLTALGQALPDGDRVAFDHASEICSAASARGAMVTLDMEDHTRTDATLAIGTALRADFPLTGNVLQANLRRTPDDLAALAELPVRIRYVKGAYREPADLAHPRKSDVDAAYRAGIEMLMRSSCYPMIATHDPAMLALARRTAADAGRAAADWEAQLLYGIRTDLQDELVAEGHRVRVYLPYGTDWYGYFMRRLAERPANVAFLLRALAHRPTPTDTAVLDPAR